MTAYGKLEECLMAAAGLALSADHLLIESHCGPVNADSKHLQALRAALMEFETAQLRLQTAVPTDLAEKRIWIDDEEPFADLDGREIDTLGKAGGHLSDTIDTGPGPYIKLMDGLLLPD